MGVRNRCKCADPLSVSHSPLTIASPSSIPFSTPLMMPLSVLWFHFESPHGSMRLSLDADAVLGSPQRSIPQRTVRHLMFSLLLSLPSRANIPKPPSKEVIEALPECLWTSSCAAQSCSVCLEDFKESSLLLTLPCGHAFHSKCCKKWLENHRTCPNCRADVADVPTTSFAASAQQSSSQQSSSRVRPPSACVETRSMKRRRTDST